MQRQRTTKKPLTGKIASLPLQIRCEVSKRIHNNESPIDIAEWLNNEVPVLEVIEAKFDFDPVSVSDIEEWKNGGFLEWIPATDFSEHAHVMSEHASDMRAAGLTTDDLFMTVLAYHAQFIRALDIVSYEVASHRMDLLERLTKNVLSLRKSELAEARKEIEVGRLELARERQQSKSISALSSPALSSLENPASLPDARPSATPALKSSASDQSTDQSSASPVEAAPTSAADPVHPVHPVHAPVPHSEPVLKTRPSMQAAASGSALDHSTAGAALPSADPIAPDPIPDPQGACRPSVRTGVPSTASPRNKFGLL